MEIDEYLKKTGSSLELLSVQTGISYPALVAIKSGKSRPHLKNAEKIILATKGEVTMKDLRGKNDRTNDNGSR